MRAPPRLLLLAPLLLLVASGCGSSKTAQCTGPRPYAGALPVKAAPASVYDGRQAGAIEGALEPGLVRELDAALDDLLVRSKAPGASVAVALPGQGIWTASRGLALTQPETPVDAETRFQAASIGKMFTATLVLRLVEQGRLRLDERVSRWFPDYPGAELMTVEHLLTHTSGTFSFNSDPERDLRLNGAPPDALIASAAEHPNLFCPGEAWAYSNTGYVMLGRIVEELTGQPLADVIARELTGPLGLTHTVGQRLGESAPERAGWAWGHTNERAPYAAGLDYATPHGAGFVASTAGDLVRFLHALLSGRVLTPETMRGRLAVAYPMFNEERLYYGQGMILYATPEGPGVMVGHSGGMMGFRSIVAYLPEEQAYISVMLNSEQPAEAGLYVLYQALRHYRGKAP